jgi:hypothetical protein
MAISKEGLVLLTATSFLSPLSKYTKITAGGSLITSNQLMPSSAITDKVSDISHNGNTVTMGQDSYSQVTSRNQQLAKLPYLYIPLHTCTSKNTVILGYIFPI